MFDFNYTQSDTTRHYLRTAATPASGRVELDNITGLNIGDYVTIRDSATSSFSYYRNYQQGEIFHIKMFSQNAENAIVPDNYLYGNYKHIENNESYVIKTDFGSLTISDISFILDEKLNPIFDSRGLLFEHYRLQAEKVEVQKFRYCFNVQYCLDSYISDCTINSNPETASGIDNYGLMILNSQNVTVDGGSYHGGNHGIAIGGYYAGNYSIVNRFIHVCNVKAYSYKFTAGINAHGNAEYCNFSNNFTNGINICANHGICIGNVCETVIEQEELLGFDHIISNNIVNGGIHLYLRHLKTPYTSSYDNYTISEKNKLLIKGNNTNDCFIEIIQNQSLTDNYIESCEICIDGNIINGLQGYTMCMYDADNKVIQDSDYTLDICNNKCENAGYYRSNAPFTIFRNNRDCHHFSLSTRKLMLEGNNVSKQLDGYCFTICNVVEGTNYKFNFIEGFALNNKTSGHFINLTKVDDTAFTLYCKGNIVLDDARFLGLDSVNDPSTVNYNIYWDDNNVIYGHYCNNSTAPAKSTVLRKYIDNPFNQYTEQKNNPLGLLLYKHLDVSNPLAYMNAIGEMFPLSPLHGVRLDKNKDCFSIPFTITSGNYLDCILAVRDGAKSALIHIVNIGGIAKGTIVSNEDFATITYPISFLRDNSNGKYYIKLGNLTTGYPYAVIYVTNTLYTGKDFVQTLDSTDLTGFTNIVIYGHDGAVYDVNRNGITDDRPVGHSIYKGFMYFDTTLGKPIYASAISGNIVTWVDATGTTV